MKEVQERLAEVLKADYTNVEVIPFEPGELPEILFTDGEHDLAVKIQLI